MNRVRRWRPDREWLALSLAAAGIVTGLDAVLLHVRRDYFTGGFLSTDAATAWADRLAFLVGSIATDFVLVSLGVLVALLVANLMALPRLARGSLALAAGAGPLILASLVEYRVFAQLGDAFDFFLMFDLVGRRPGEILAVTAGYLLGPIVATTLLAVAVALVVWGLAKRYPDGRRQVPLISVAVGWIVLGVTGTCAMAAMRVSSDVLDNGLRRKPAGQVLGSLVDGLSDVDGDGYGVLSRPPDPAPRDARVYPYALDIPGNGVDEDGVGGDLPAGPPYTETRRPVPRFAQTPPVVVVMLETFRADLLGLRHDGREVTPVLNALAREGASAARAYSHNGYTVQSRYHFFTGSLAGLHGGTTLLDDFAANGYEVAYFSGQDESFGGDRFAVGAERADVFYDARQDADRRYTTFATAGSLGVSSAVVLERVDAFLETRDAARPLFLYVSLYDTHFPYAHDGMDVRIPHARLAQAEIVPARADDLRAMYYNAAAHVDAAIGRLIDAVERHLGTRPAVLVLADHGESLFEEGFLGHGYAINEVQTRIPLVVRGLPLDLCEPLGQADLRGGIVEALVGPSPDAAPRFRVCPDAQVFQYVGLLHRPPQIALTDVDRRVVYQFRDDAVRTDDAPWRPAPPGEESLRDAWLDVVRFWERLRLAQASEEQR